MGSSAVGPAGDGEQAKSLDEGMPESPTRRAQAVAKRLLWAPVPQRGTGTAARLGLGWRDGAPPQAGSRGSPAAPAGSLAGVDTKGRSGPAPCLHLFGLQVLVEQGSAEDGERLL